MTAVGPPRLLATVFGQPREQRPYSTLQLIFDGGRLTDAQIRGNRLNPREHDAVRVLPLAEWEALMPARDFVRLRAVEEARRAGVVAYVDTWGTHDQQRHRLDVRPASRRDPCHGEVLLDAQVHGLMVDDRKQDAAGAWAHVRQGVLTRLQQAQSLLPGGVRLLFIEGYRPPSLQRRYFEEYSDELARAHPDWQAAAIREAASRLVSPPEIAPHSAGAAVDVTRIDHQGREPDMGTRVNASPEESSGACYSDAPNLSARARTNRATLDGALSTAGLINYGTEWWHWSYGERYWAVITGETAACYGPTEITRLG